VRFAFSYCHDIALKNEFAFLIFLVSITIAKTATKINLSLIIDNLRTSF